MTFELTPERLQQIAVECVTQFISKQASLNEAIAKEAMDLELNSEQTKRVIEASNTIAYLRQLEKSADRTFEFEVADFGKVMATMCMPDDMLKAAGTPPWLDKDQDKKEDSKEDDKGEKKDKSDKDDSKEEKNKGEDFGRNKNGDKKDKDEDKDEKSESKDEDSDEEKQEKRAMLMKGYFSAKETLEKMAYDETSITMALVKAAGVVGKDRHGLEKLAAVVAAEDLDKTARLCGLEKRAQEDIVVVARDLKDANAFYAVYKEAQAFLTKKAELADFVQRAETFLFKSPVDLEKQAFLGMLARGVGYVAGRAVGALGGAAAGTVKNFGAFSKASKRAGYRSTAEGIKEYDKIKGTQGLGAAYNKFGGQKPGFGNRLVHSVGLTGALTATTGLSMEHKNNVKDL